jgi:hypothetical protein
MSADAWLAPERIRGCRDAITMIDAIDMIDVIDRFAGKRAA